MNYLDVIVDICHSNLSGDHKKYMVSRGFSDKTIEEFQIGTFFSEAIRDKVPIDFLEEKKILFRNKHGKFWSEFDKRVIIPIVDHNGIVSGITGRIVEDSDRAKYCNSNYSKSGVLFGLDKAKKDVLKSNAVIVVEGNLDVMAAVESGFRNVVAICGTAMSEKHVHLLLRYCNNIILGLDNDKAGAAARGRSLEMLGYYANSGLVNVSLLDMPDGVKDINELLCKEGPEACRSFLTRSVPNTDPAQNPDTLWEWQING